MEKRMEAKKGKCVPVRVNSQTKGLGQGNKQRALGTLIGHSHRTLSNLIKQQRLQLRVE